MKTLPVPIPLDLADTLGVHYTLVIHWNAGRRRPQIAAACKLMELSLTDERLTGLCFYHLRPELEPAQKWLCGIKKKNGRVVKTQKRN